MKQQWKHTLAALSVGGTLLLSTWGARAADAPAAPVPPANAAVTLKTLPDDAAAAKVNGVEIPMREINQAVEAIKQRQPALADGSSEANARLGEFQHSMLNDLVDFQLLLQEAKKRNIAPEAKKIDAQIWQMRARFPSEEAYNNWLKTSGETETSLRQTASDNMAVEELGSQLALDITVNDDDLQKFYNENREKGAFDVPDSVLVSHILIAVKPDATPEEKKKGEVKAQDVLKQALSGKTSFSDLAAQYSQDKATSATGGSLGYLVKIENGTWKPVVDAAFEGSPGKVVNRVVKTDFGYHIVKPIEKKPGQTLTLDEVRNDIKQVVLHQKVQARIEEELAKLRKAAAIQINI